MKQLKLSGLLCLWLCLISGAIRAQSVQNIEINSSVESDLTAGESQFWSFTARGTMIVTIYAEKISGDLDPEIALLDSNDNVLISNDDINYPESNDALIQAFDLPGNGNYSIKVSAFGETSGTYRLAVQTGYSQIAFADDFSDNSDWSTLSDASLNQQIEDGHLTLELSGIKQNASILANQSPDVKDFYLHADFSDIIGRNGWHAGLIFRQQDKTHYYRLAVNEQGFWQMDAIDGDSVTIVRDWSTHPVIVAGVPEFELGVLANGNSFDVFYNGQLVGSVMDSRYPDAGKIGVSVATSDALNSDVSLTVDNVVLTQPLMIDDVPLFPQVLHETTPTNMIRALERQHVIPLGGEMKLTVGESFAQNVQPGVSRFSIGGSVQYTQFVMGATISWIVQGDGIGGCGITFNSVSSDNYSVAYLDRSGGYGISHRQGDAFVPGIFGEGLDSTVTSRDVMIIVQDEKVHYYVDGRHLGSMDYSPVAGEIGIAVVNFDGSDTSCQFNNLWLWSLDSVTAN